VIVGAVTPSPYWFITRGTGAIALVLLTVSVALGIADVRRTRLPGVPRFVFDALHRSASLLAVAFLFVHIVTSVLDGFAPISLIDAVVPLHSAYRPIWLGLGAVACDLMLAVTITSLLRARLGYRAWRTVHWLAYLSWPVAVVHTFGTGSDAKTHWLLLLTGICVAVMLVAVVARVMSGWPGNLPVRVGALGAAALVPIGLVAWLPSGPLGHGWARRAGTPAAVLAAVRGTPVSSSAAGGGGGSSASSSAAASGPSTGSISGTVRQAQQSDGSALVDILLTVGSGPLHDVHIRIRGEPAAGGGVQMTSSRVSAGPMSNPDQYHGRVTALDGTTVEAAVADSAGTRLQVLAQLNVAPGSDAVTGSLTTTPTH
jgi:DMSO/TMAO reductase YedYZ heme-binding membrane subunit